MGDPVIVERAAHSLSRSQIDPDALKVLYRLHQNSYVAYLVGGSVRDLLLGRRPKDFDIGTSAHPYQVKRLFKNCWVIGRRFRLAHVRFGMKTIEVATFRRKVTAEELAAAEEAAAELRETPEEGNAGPGLIHRENTFGTPEEDAFRRDFTINALFYDIGTFSIIDYTGGLEDLRAGIVRSIGDPAERFHEDPVRMLRAIAMAARLGFTIDAPIDNAIGNGRAEIARSAPARLIEEFYKLLRSGASEQAFRMMAERRLLEPIAHDLQKGAGDRLWQSLAAVDAYRKRHEDTPDTLSNAILLGSLLVPLGMSGHPRQPAGTELEKEPRLTLGMLPLARRDVERFRQIMGLQRRLLDARLSPRARRALMHRGPFREALDVAGDSWPGARGRRALARVHRSLWRHVERAGRRRRNSRARDAGAGVEGDRSDRRRASRACARTRA